MHRNQDEREELLDRLLKLSLQIPMRTNRLQTAVPFLHIMKESRPRVMARGPLLPSLCMVLQGKTRLQVGDDTIEHQRGDLLATSVNMPAAGRILEAAAHEPYVALRVELPPGEAAAVATEAGLRLPPKPEPHPGIFVGKPTLEVLEGFGKLLRLSQYPKAAKYLASAVKKELIFWLLDSEEGARFYHNIMWHQEASGISKVIDWVTGNFDSTVSIEELAEMGNMSVSSLHYKFKEMTGLAPQQFQKRLRLQEARRLLLDGANVTETALRTGYQSSTQFSREYKRLFGLSPVQHIRVLHEGGQPGEQ